MKKVNSGQFKKGQKAWNKGKFWDEKVKEKLSKAHQENPTRYWLGKKRPDMIGNTCGFVKGKPSPRKDKKSRYPVWNKGKRAKDDNRVLVGKNSPRWKGGTSRGYKDGYYSADYKKWRMDVFQRDNFECKGCNKVGGYLTAHHIKSFRFYPELRFDISNGITLCEECHKLTDNYGGAKKEL